MRYLSRNTHLLRSVLAILVFLASSGFTTILHNCTMDATACCQVSTQSGHDGCDAALSLPNQKVAYQADFDCHINTLVGGVITNPAVFEKENKIDLKKTSGLVSALAPVVHASPQACITSSDLPSRTLAVFHPAVEKYVLYSSFLI